MKPSEIIRQGWIQGGLACDNQGNSADPYSPSAVKFCVLGAFLRAFGGNSSSYQNAISVTVKALPSWVCGPGVYRIEKWNDHPSQTQETVAAFLEGLGL
mgnify:CR=1 FL=1